MKKSINHQTTFGSAVFSLTWHAYESYGTVQDFVCSVKVVNNAAERDVKLHSDYAAILIDNGKQCESLPQVVEQHQQ